MQDPGKPIAEVTDTLSAREKEKEAMLFLLEYLATRGREVYTAFEKERLRLPLSLKEPIEMAEVALVLTEAWLEARKEKG